MAKITLKTLTSGFLSNSQINDNFDTIEAAFEKALFRDGEAPNSMTADLDMNSNKIVNIGPPTSGLDAVTKAFGDANYGGAAAAAAETAQGLAEDAQAAAELAETGAQTAESGAVTAETKAETWADNNEDVPVETSPDKFSAKHWAIKTEAEGTSAISAIQSQESTSLTALTDQEALSVTAVQNEVPPAEAARDDARDWASEAEDVTVSDGVNPDGYSAFHHAEKAKDARDAALAAIRPIDTVTETITSGAVDFNLNTALYYIVNVDQDFTATFSGLASGVTNNAYIELINAGDHTVTWINAAWDGGSEAPLLGVKQAFDLTVASYDNVSFSVASEDGAPRSIHFKPDGTKMYMVGASSDSVHQYTLSTAFDLSTASFDNISFSVASEDGSPYGIHFNPDGTKMYIAGRTSDSVYQYTLSTAWDLSTASFDNVSFSVSGQDVNPTTMHFKPDGIKMYMVGVNSDSVHQYSLSTAWDLSTASFDNVSFSVFGQDGDPFAIHFKPDGTKMYMVGASSKSVHQYTLSTAWDLSTASYDNVSFSVSGEDGNPQSIHFKPDGTKMYMLGGSSDSVYQYSTGTSGSQSTLIEAIAQDDGTTPVKLRKIWDEA